MGARWEVKAFEAQRGIEDEGNVYFFLIATVLVSRGVLRRNPLRVWEIVLA